MDLARALTHRRRQPADLSKFAPGRANSLKTQGINRSKISSPLELVSSTNVLAYNAPNIYNSPSSPDDSDASMQFSGSSRATTPDSDSPIALAASTPPLPGFYSPRKASDLSSSHQSKSSLSISHSPLAPTSAPSFSAHVAERTRQATSHKRAESRSREQQPPDTIPLVPALSVHSPTSLSVTPAASTRSHDFFSIEPDASHPFGAELAEVNAMAEDFGARDVIIMDEEEQYLISHGLYKFCAEEYIDEVQGLFGGIYNNPFSHHATAWI